MKDKITEYVFNMFSLSFESNVSQIEKVLSKIKVNRFISTNLFFIFGITIATLSLYFSVRYFYDYILLLSLAPILLIFICVVTIKSINSDFDLGKGGWEYYYSIAVEIFFLFWSYKTAINVIDNFSFQNTILFLMVLTPSLLFLYSIYQTSKTVAMIISKKVLREQLLVTLTLTDGKVITGYLIDIDKKNNFILNDNQQKSEVLVKDSVIATISIPRDKEESMKD